MGKTLTTNEFIERARKVHDDKYDYSKVEYANSRTKVCIICPEHGAFLQLPYDHLKGRGCRKCGIIRTHNYQRKSIEDFINQAISIHNNRYDYALFAYNSAHDKSQIICPIHGIFLQSPDSHLRGHGCPKCGDEAHKKLVYGFGINDCDESIHKEKAYKIWNDMLARCYNYNVKLQHPTYQSCTCCDEWRYYSNFKIWFDSQFYKDGYHLDKDILRQGNKVYSPNTCCFVPSYINSLIVYKAKQTGDLMRGVSKEKGQKSYRASCCVNKRNVHLGSFKTQEEAHEMYKKVKYAEIRRVAQCALDSGDIDIRVYNALLNYKINKY